MFVGHAHGEHDAWTLLGQTSCAGNLDTAWTCRFLVRVTWCCCNLGYVSCVSNLDAAHTVSCGSNFGCCLNRFPMRVTWALLVWTGFLCVYNLNRFLW